MPIRPGLVDATVRRLEALPRRDSPFSRVPGTHFARLAVIDRTVAGRHPNVDVPLKHSWLLFVADFDGRFTDVEGRRARPPASESARYLCQVLAEPALSSIWDDCYGFDRPARRMDALHASIVARAVFFRDYPGSTLADVLDALDVQARLMSWLANANLTDAAAIGHFLDDLIATL